ncbi:hypothetical protein DXV76_12825 [Rhodobacteraceae bacterium CCMM004]|nr:hypothetical protein DXV76_12825 [Rhodobacteraceae bacterium CCMM004]
MASLAQLQQMRADLEAARYSGERRLRDANGQEVEYRSDAELRRALSAINSEIARMSGVSRTISYPVTSKGL